MDARKGQIKLKFIKKHLEIWKIVRIFAARYNNLKQFGR
jgi:hypothetical protein